MEAAPSMRCPYSKCRRRSYLANAVTMTSQGAMPDHPGSSTYAFVCSRHHVFTGHTDEALQDHLKRLGVS